MRNNVLSDALYRLSNAEKKNKKEVTLHPSSKIIIKFLRIMQKYKYIGKFTKIDDHRSGKIILELLGRINKCRVISPRYNIRFENIKKWISNLLPSQKSGIIVLTTSSGIMDHKKSSSRKNRRQNTRFFLLKK